MSEVENWAATLQQLIEQPYPDQNATLAGWMHSEDLETHLLATPNRKTALILDKTGDYEYDEGMSLDEEVKMASEVDNCYQRLCQQISGLYGPAVDIGINDPSLQSRVEPEDYTDLCAEIDSYLLGAYYDNGDDDEASFWLVRDHYVCLQKIKKWGDGNFQFYVIATVTPRLPA